MKFTGTVTHLSQKGLGVVKNTENNISYFVYGTWPGDSGEFEIIDKPLNNKKFAYAKLIQLIHPSAQRQIPPCPFVSLEENACTGCSWMIADYTSQLEQKRNRFLYAMQRAGFDPAQLNVNAIQPAPQIYGYRNRCQIKTDGIKLGFVSENSQQIAPMDDCLVLNERCRSLLQTAIQQLPNETWQENSGDNWLFIELDDDMQPDEIRTNRKRPFKQGNTQQNQWMQQWLRNTLARNSQIGKVVELFCGSGNFTQIIAESNCTALLAYESDPDAIQVLKSKALAKVTPQVADLFSPSIWRNIQKTVCDATTLVLDPPRAGLKKHQGFFSCFAALKTIIYISCNPETFARDAWFFQQNSWQINEVQLIDLFPHTPHIEILAEFRKI
ncbi:class I SAM-dependent RNA methyltransferase [Nitrosomonas oligotropha]|uniref:23S rRNA m(5)U-1939 methyltransferase n=1 Tax=Nitrosomonas oligotropha TaxID=42354 RepID=A0A1H8MDL9_9PROT|nr:class I SAM-dependent RNA methyltransferase [Nitrosomonas oligotropha]SDW47378.1 23S rRNA m(5)U-1939 methyltransferase [Nitrosomonas oligotropha]SEO15429.1 23S rRNA m(5)U-1939 methyltransferase [Nitrosomonas oligotropha]